MKHIKTQTMIMPRRASVEDCCACLEASGDNVRKCIDKGRCEQFDSLLCE